MGETLLYPHRGKGESRTRQNCSHRSRNEKKKQILFGACVVGAHLVSLLESEVQVVVPHS